MLVLTIERDDFHDKIEILPNERCDVGVLLALGGAEGLPGFLVCKERFLRLGEALEHTFARLQKAAEILHLAGFELLVFALDDDQQFAAKGEMGAQFLLQRGQAVAGSRMKRFWGEAHRVGFSYGSGLAAFIQLLDLKLQIVPTEQGEVFHQLQCRGDFVQVGI